MCSPKDGQGTNVNKVEIEQVGKAACGSDKESRSLLGRGMQCGVVDRSAVIGHLLMRFGQGRMALETTMP